METKIQKGFTLVEVLIVIAIIGIMSTVSLVSLSSNREKKDVESAAREVVAAIREAQNYAVTGKQPDTTTPKFPCNYKLSPTVNSANYTINYDYHVSGTDCVTPAPINNSPAYISYTLKNGVTFSTVADVSFSVPFAVTTGGKIVLQKGASFYTVCVSSAGKINELANNVACP